MSASNQKKNPSGATLTERQLNEIKEAKKLRNMTIGFVVVMVLVLCVAIFSFVNSALSSSGYRDRHTVAANIDGQDYSSVELNYYYIDGINNFYNQLKQQYGDYAAMYGNFFYGVDFTSPLGNQAHPEGGTWGEYFINLAGDTMKNTVALCKAANAEGVTLNEANQADIEGQMSMLDLYANLSGMKDADAYLKAMYGNGASKESFQKYFSDGILANQYYNDHLASLTYTSEQLREAEKDEPYRYNSYTGNYYYVSSSSFLEGGETDEDGKVTYSDEQRAAALAKAEAVAQELASGSYVKAATFDQAVADLEINQGTNVSSTIFENALYSSVTSVLQDWISDESRTCGDTVVIPAETTDSEGNTNVSGYYVGFFESVNKNEYALANVRHLLVSFEGGTQDANGTTTYSDEEKAAALAKANEYLAQWENGEKTEESFAALVTEYTDDTASASNGGLYENISVDSSFVSAFENWAVDASRKVGDVEIVETEYGYHIMYFSSYSADTYRDQMITTTLKNQDQNAWFEAITSASTLTMKNTSRLNQNIAINSAN